MSSNGERAVGNDTNHAQARQWVFVGLLGLAYAAAAFVADGLHQPLYKDEKHFWPTVQLFQTFDFPPSIEQLHSYPEVLTPLSFMAWSRVELWTDGGIFSLRLFTLLLSFASICIIALRRTPDNAAMLAGIGLLLYPYTLPLSVHVYTDVPGTFLMLVGAALYVHRLPVAGSLFFVLAIATRQYLLAVPAALAAWALIEWIRGQERGVLFWLAPACASATILGWLLLFGGLGPAAGMDKWVPLYPAPMVELLYFIPEYGLYFLTVVGAFFVIPEFLLYRRWQNLQLDSLPRWLLIAGVLAVAYATFPPMTYQVPMGALDRVIRPCVPNDFVRMLVFYLLALATCLRFARLDLAFWILVVHFFMNMKAQLAWEKYAFPALAILWYLKSIHALDGGRVLRPRSEGSHS